MHICVSKLTITGSDNGLSPGRRQATIWTNAGILLIRTLGTNLSETLSKILTFSFKKCILKYRMGNGGIWVHCYPWLNKASVGDRRFYICNCLLKPWWRHSFRVTGPLCSQRPVTRSFDVFFDLRLNKWLSKQSRRRWFEMPSRSLWPHCNNFLPWLLYSCMQYIITSGYLQLHFTVLWMM